MSDATICYELPMNERLRFFLRLEFMFMKFNKQKETDSIAYSHTAIMTLIEILKFVSQQDVKKEILKELDRITGALQRLQDSPKVVPAKLSGVLTEISELRSKFREIDGPIGKSLRENEFIKILINRNSAPGGLSQFDPPYYCYWLNQDYERRLADLETWHSSFAYLDTAISLILSMIRDSSRATPQVASNGSYQQNLNTKTPNQLVSVSLPQDSPYYAEISGSKHRITIRFMDTTTSPRPTATTNHVEFLLSCCIL
ncbi:MAG: cell division protein ZapD [Thiohalomonadales bacterium]